MCKNKSVNQSCNRGGFDARTGLPLPARGRPAWGTARAAPRSLRERGSKPASPAPSRRRCHCHFRGALPAAPQQRGGGTASPKPEPNRGVTLLPAPGPREEGKAGPARPRPAGPRAHLLAEAADLALAQLPALVQLLDPLVQLLGETLLLHGGGAARRVGPGQGRAGPRRARGPRGPGPPDGGGATTGTRGLLGSA